MPAARIAVNAAITALFCMSRGVWSVTRDRLLTALNTPASPPCPSAP